MAKPYLGPLVLWERWGVSALFRTGLAKPYLGPSAWGPLVMLQKQKAAAASASSGGRALRARVCVR